LSRERPQPARPTRAGAAADALRDDAADAFARVAEGVAPPLHKEPARTEEEARMLKTNRILTIFTALTAVALASGCLSSEELEARRQWAYDLAGEYDEVRTGDATAGSVEVVNEDGKNDVKLVYARGDLHTGEQEYIDRVADETERAALAAELIIGEGDSALQDRLVGAENYSDDFGESSTIVTSSERFVATPSEEGASDAKVWYSVTLNIVNGSDELRGTLAVHFEERRPDPTDEDPDNTELEIESERFDLVLKRRAGPIEAEVCIECTEGPQDEEGDLDPTTGDGDAAGDLGDGSSDTTADSADGEGGDA
jgi:hypothetical protein